MTLALEKGEARRGEVPHLALTSNIRTKFLNVDERHIARSGTSGGDGGVLFLEVPVQPLIDEGILDDVGIVIPDHPQPKARLRLVSGRGLTSLRLSILPKDRKPKRPEFDFEHTELDIDHGGILQGKVETSPQPLVMETPSAEGIEALGTIIDRAEPIRSTERDYRDAFRELISGLGFGAHDQHEVMETFNVMWDAHEGELRRSGERFVEHPLGAIENLIRLGLGSPTIIKLLLVHDAPEDYEGLKQPEIRPGTDRASMSYREWSSVITLLFTPIVGVKTAELLPLMSRPVPDGVELFNEEDCERRYNNNIESREELIIAKDGGDRWHNDDTLWAMKKSQRDSTIRETREVNIPRLKTLEWKYPELIRELVDDMESEMAWLEKAGTSIDP